MTMTDWVYDPLLHDTGTVSRALLRQMTRFLA